MECKNCVVLQRKLDKILKSVQPLIRLVHPEGIKCPSPVNTSTPSKLGTTSLLENTLESFKPGAGRDELTIYTPAEKSTAINKEGISVVKHATKEIKEDKPILGSKWITCRKPICGNSKLVQETRGINTTNIRQVKKRIFAEKVEESADDDETFYEEEAENDRKKDDLSLQKLNHETISGKWIDRKRSHSTEAVAQQDSSNGRKRKASAQAAQHNSSYDRVPMKEDKYMTKREKRRLKKLEQAYSCHQCEGFFNAAGLEIMNTCGKHRGPKPPPTPPGYWNPGWNSPKKPSQQ